MEHAFYRSHAADRNASRHQQAPLLSAPSHSMLQRSQRACSSLAAAASHRRITLSMPSSAAQPTATISSSAAELSTATPVAISGPSTRAPPDCLGPERCTGLPDFSMLRGCLFDIDGTLCNSDPVHLVAFQQMLAEVGFNGGAPIDEEFFRVHISGRHNPEITAALLPHLSLSEREDFANRKEARFRELAASQLQRMPGLTELLNWVQLRRLRLAAITNAPRANAELMLSGLGLQNTFEHVVLGEECLRAKPFPDPYLRALELLGLAPGEALVLEDSPAGLQAAVAAGVAAVGIASTQEEGVLRAAGACAVVRDFHELAIRAEEDCRRAAQAVH